MTSIVGQAEQYVKQLFQEKLTPDHYYHNLPHTQMVVDATRLLASRHELSIAEREALELAAWFHDTGFTETYEDHEEAGVLIAKAWLEVIEYEPAAIEMVCRLIQATQMGHEPTDLLEKILRDADLSNVGRADYLAMLSGLRHEWEVFREEEHGNREWYKLNYAFVSNHRYNTTAAAEIYGTQHQQNVATLKKLASKKKKKKKKKNQKSEKVDTRTGNTIATNRSAQMMFKTALRNHMDLSNLADNKANIMLSVNALIVTIAVPMAAGYVNSNPKLMIPVIILLLTCLCSMIFATLATRPIPMTGLTTQEDIHQGRSNLFFFGNFYRMSIKEYDEGMDEVIKKDGNLESAIKRDLYFLGRSLGNKYNQLRVCYNLFMVGVVLSVILFGLSYAIFQ
ncbi:MAG: Pycsar system effector family protein [Bacteroidota bacterium]